MRFFKLTQIEQDRAKKFINRHVGHAATVTYLFTIPPNGMGMSIKIKCDRCGKSENITEFK
jgi:hypothetical protein